jgi:hypothetical protein
MNKYYKIAIKNITDKNHPLMLENPDLIEINIPDLPDGVDISDIDMQLISEDKKNKEFFIKVRGGKTDKLSSIEEKALSDKLEDKKIMPIFGIED